MSELAKWFSASEIAALKLSKLRLERAGVHRRAVREHWPFRDEVRQGGRCRVYLLPEKYLEASDATICGSAPPAPRRDKTARPELWRRFDAAPDVKKARAIDAAMAVRHFLDPKNNEPPKEAYKGRTLRRFAKKVRGYEPHDYAPVLLDERNGRPREQQYSSRFDDLFRADYLRPERSSAQASYDRIIQIAATESLSPIPSLRTLERRMRAAISWQAISLARNGQRAFEAAFPAQERDRSGFRAMEALCADGWRADNLVEWPDGEIARPIIVSWQDLCSGAIVGWRADRTENLDLIRLSFGDVLRSYGIPDEVYLDNGHAFSGYWLSGRTPHRFRFKLRAEEPAGIFNLLGIRVHWATPHHGQSKPIERAHREFTDRISRHPRLAGSWTGPNTVDRPEVRAERPAKLADFLDVVASEIKAHNERSGRRAKNCNGRSFWETFTESYERGPIRKATAEQLALALLAVEGVKVSARDGTFKLAGDNRYYSQAVAAFAGRTIAVRFDPQNLKQTVYCYQLSGEPIGAAECVLPVGFNDTAAAREHARDKRQWIKGQKENLERERRLSAKDVVALMPNAPAAPEIVRAKVVRLVPRVVEPPVLRPTLGGDLDNDPRWRNYCAIKARQERGEALDADELAAIGIYERSADYRIRMDEMEAAAQ